MGGRGKETQLKTSLKRPGTNIFKVREKPAYNRENPTIERWS